MHAFGRCRSSFTSSNIGAITGEAAFLTQAPHTAVLRALPRGARGMRFGDDGRRGGEGSLVWLRAGGMNRPSTLRPS